MSTADNSPPAILGPHSSGQLLKAGRMRSSLSGSGQTVVQKRLKVEAKVC